MERAIVGARWLGTAFLIVIGPLIPNVGTAYIWALAAYILVYDRLMVMAAARGAHPDRLNVAGVILDGSALIAALFLFAAQAAWDATIVIPIFLLAVAFRVGSKAVLWALPVFSVVDALLSLYRAERFGYEFSFEGLLFRIGAYALAAMVVTGILRQLTELRTAQTTLFEPLLRAQDALGEAILIRDGDRLTTVSDAFVRLTGYDRSEIPDLAALIDLVPEEERGAVLDRMAGATQDRFDMKLVRKDGHVLTVEVARKAVGEPDSTKVVVLLRDVTERKRAQQELEQSVLRDALTGLPNAVVLKDRMHVAIADARRQATSSALLLIVLHGFRFVNETVGLTGSNRILFELAGRLREQTREVDTVARVGGDAFAVLLPDCDDAGARRVAASIADALAEPYDIGAFAIGPLDIRTSIGIALWPAHADTPDALLRDAEIAARHAVRDDEAFVVYRPEHHIKTAEAFSTIAELRAAIRDGQIVLHYQPVIDLRDQHVISLEALARWQHPKRGLRTAAEFIGLAEEAGLIRQLSDAVFARLTVDAATLTRDPRTEPLSIAMNLSARSLRDEELARKVKSTLRANALPAWRLTFEVTETAVMVDPEMSVRILNELRAIGVRVMLDDFGTGHSSLAYLQRLPIQGLKIDRSFVAAMNTDKASSAIVRGTIDLAKRLDLQIVVEGVEDRRALEAVRSFGADAAQGYAIARPMPLAEVAGWLESYEHALIGIDPTRISASRS
jgi:diguanylate cyclase (GGDEF)-like protein/PAS domain S-box-containing protein